MQYSRVRPINNVYQMCNCRNTNTRAYVIMSAFRVSIVRMVCACFILFDFSMLYYFCSSSHQWNVQFYNESAHGECNCCWRGENVRVNQFYVKYFPFVGLASTVQWNVRINVWDINRAASSQWILYQRNVFWHLGMHQQRRTMQLQLFGMFGCDFRTKIRLKNRSRKCFIRKCFLAGAIQYCKLHSIYQI
jgi:hypothetical protein